MTSDEAARTGLMMLCMLTAGPFSLGLLLGFLFARRWLALGWWSFVPWFVRRWLEDEHGE